MIEFIGVIIILIIYIMPILVALRNRHENLASIAIVNIFLGFTYIGWVLSLAWAYSNKNVGSRCKWT